MGKHKKTRHEKITADLRRTVQSAPAVYSLEYEYDTPSKTTITTPPQKNSEYGYVVNDITKIFFLTGVILTLELSLFFLLKNTTVALPIPGF